MPYPCVFGSRNCKVPGTLAARASISCQELTLESILPKGTMGESAGELWFISNNTLSDPPSWLRCWCIIVQLPSTSHGITLSQVFCPCSLVHHFRLEGGHKFPAGFIRPGCMVSNSVGLSGTWECTFLTRVRGSANLEPCFENQLLLQASQQWWLTF